jgi:hypothetical protein
MDPDWNLISVSFAVLDRPGIGVAPEAPRFRPRLP